MESSDRPPKLLDRVRTAIRTRHYSRRTEDAYTHWIRAYIVFHGKAHPASLGAAEVSAFVSWLAEQRRVSPSKQNQALSAVLCGAGGSSGGDCQTSRTAYAAALLCDASAGVRV